MSLIVGLIISYDSRQNRAGRSDPQQWQTILRLKCDTGIFFAKKYLIWRKFLVCFSQFRTNSEGTGKKVLTYQVHSDNQDGNQVIFVYNIEFGSALMRCGA